MLTLNVQEPLADDVRGQRNQYRLRHAAQVEEATQDSVFFRALYSEVANCNMLGVHHELGRRGTSLTRYWSVRDHSVPVPEGGVRLVEGTPEWHEALATSRYVMVNVHQPDWYRKPRGQVLIETMHGYPYKVMGHEWWEKGGFPTGPDQQLRPSGPGLGLLRLARDVRHSSAEGGVPRAGRRDGRGARDRLPAQRRAAVRRGAGDP